MFLRHKNCFEIKFDVFINLLFVLKFRAQNILNAQAKNRNNNNNKEEILEINHQ